MKRVILLLMLCSASLLSAYSQETPKKLTFQWDQETMDKVGLTAEQRQKFAEIQKETNLASSAIRKDATLTEEQKKEKMKELVATRSAKQHAVLTPEQLKTTSQIKQQIRAVNAAAGLQ